MFRRLATLTAVLALAACGPDRRAPIANALPAGDSAVAVLDMAALRASGSLGTLPPAVVALAGPLREAREWAISWNGKDLLLVAAGEFAQPPAGYTAIGRGMAAAGPVERIDAARAALGVGKNGAADLPPGAAPIRAVVRGDGKLPLSGNLENAAKLLRMANSTTVAVHIQDLVELEIAGQCASVERARTLEESMRAMMTLGAAAGTRDSEIAKLLRSVRITRESATVRTQAIGSAEAFRKLF